MPYDSKGVANYFLKKAWEEDKPIRHMKLQKLLYYAQGYYLAIVGKPLLSDGIQAWDWGPIVDSVYHEFKYCGRDPIDEPAVESHDGEDMREISPPDDELAQRILDKVWEEYKEFDDLQLSDMTHEEGTPWDTAKKKHGPAARGVFIDDETMKRYFLEQELNASATG